MGEAREYVRPELGLVLSESKLFDVELMTTELVSNAVRHAPPEGDIHLTVDVSWDLVRVSVVDAGAGFDPASGGWGLLIVEKMSERWGVEGPPHEVWFEVDL
jgi:signal transduction histidine kinase